MVKNMACNKKKPPAKLLLRREAFVVIYIALYKAS